MDISYLASIISILLFAVGVFIFYLKLKSATLKKRMMHHKNDKRIKIHNRTKNPGANVFEYRALFFKIGLVLSLSFTIMAFSWTTYHKEPTFLIDYIDIDELEIEPPRTMDRPKPPPPPPPPVIEEVPEEIVQEKPVLLDMSIEADEEIQPVLMEPKVSEEVDAPIPVFEEEPIDEIRTFSEEMPRFPGCESGNKTEQKKCSDKKLFEYLSKNLKYPTIAKENGIEGKIIVRFTVNTDGTVQDAEVLRDIGGGCGQAALDVVNNMNNMPTRWIPGKHGGQAVRVKFTLPVTFKLN